MSESTLNWRQAWGEALLIFLGVALALAGQAWWEYETDRATEVHILQGIRSDLQRDAQDANNTVRGAQARAAAADELLRLLGDTDADAIPEPEGLAQGLTEHLVTARQAYPPGAFTAGEAILMLQAIRSFDLADATYSEATASGHLAVLRDAELRAEIGSYYFNARRFGGTIDARVDASAARLSAVLSDAGLPLYGSSTDEAVLQAMRSDQKLRAELKNARGFAAYQIDRQAAVISRRELLEERIDAWLSENQ